MVIYTKKGDRGETNLYDSKSLGKARILKSSLTIKAIGAVDEANSFLGMVTSFSEDKNLVLWIKGCQRNLFAVGSILAGAPLGFSKTKTLKLEKEIDKLEKSLPTLKHFILPGGTRAASLLFVARTLARRAERSVVKLGRRQKIKPQISVYLNRLSDYLFTLARYVNFREGIKEEPWRGKDK